MSLFNFDLGNARLILAGGALVLGGGILGGGCGGGYDTSTEAGFCQALAAADCSNAIVSACYGSSDQTVSNDTNSCIAARSDLTKCNPQRLAYHPDFADACLAAHQNVYASSTIDGPTYATLTAACLPVLNNGAQQGATCTADSDCDAGDQFACVMHAGKGTCQIPVQIMGGLSCSASSAQCVDGFYCDGGLHCVASGANGDSCKAGATCGAGLRCSGASVCENQFADGQPCFADGDCTGGFCLGGGGKATGVCAATLTYAQGGTACRSFSQ